MSDDERAKRVKWATFSDLPSQPLVGKINVDFMMDFFANVGVKSIGSDDILFNELKWLSKSSFTLTRDDETQDFMTYGVPFMDYMLAKEYLATEVEVPEISFKAHPAFNDIDYSLTSYGRAVGLAFINYMTRGKTTLDKTEVMPNIAKSVFKIDDHNTFAALFSVNDLSKLNLTNIFERDWSWFPSIIQFRLSLGIAGGRLIKIPNIYPVDTKVDQETLKAFNLVKTISAKGIFLEYHPALNTKKELNLNKNLEQLYLKVYTEDTLKRMVKEKRLSKIPLRNDAYQSYLTWDESTFEYLKTPLSSKFEKVIEINSKGTMNEDDNTVDRKKTGRRQKN